MDVEWRMKRSNIEGKRTKKRGKSVFVKRNLNSKERKWRWSSSSNTNWTKAKQKPVEKANQSEQRKTKLPKLQITKFSGTYEAWLPFWNRFQAEIDKTKLSSVTKFAYLKELVDPKVRAEIDGLLSQQRATEGKEYPLWRIWENEWDRECVRPEHREFACHHIKLCLLLWFKFFKTMILLLSSLGIFPSGFAKLYSSQIGFSRQIVTDDIFSQR